MASIRKRNGKWQVQVRRNEQPAISRSFTLRTDAQEWAREIERKADRGELNRDREVLEGISLGSLVERYRDTVSSGKKGHAIEVIVLNAFLRNPICSKPLSQISSVDFAKYRDKRLKEIRPASLKRQLSPIHNMFEVARDEWGIPITENPLDRVKLKATDNRRERRLKDGELERIIEACRSTRNPFILPMILFATETAMRRSEMLSLRWGSLDLKRLSATLYESKNGYSRTIPLSHNTMELLVVLRGIQKGISNGIRVDPKGTILRCHVGRLHSESDESGFDIPVSGSGDLEESLVSDLIDSRDSLGSLNPNQAVYELTDINPEQPLFPITPNALRLSWERICKRASIKDLHFHDLRHEAISRLFEKGLTVPEVASISGHRDMRMLFRYAHAQQESIRNKL